MGPIAFPETSVCNYHYTLGKSSQERSSHIRNTFFLVFIAKGNVEIAGGKEAEGV